jgi:hypothetical protein
LGALFFVSVAVLPIIAGFRVARAGGHRIHWCLGGVAISVTSLVCAAFTQVITQPDWPRRAAARRGSRSIGNSA